ncbi:MAG: helix-turn-helix transcriptional regulator [Fimbriimonadaceae bacterium]
MLDQVISGAAKLESSPGSLLLNRGSDTDTIGSSPGAFDSAAWMRAVRDVSGHTQVGLATLLGVRQSTISKWESGQLVMDLETARAIFDKLDLPNELSLLPSEGKLTFQQCLEEYRNIAEDLSTDSTWLLDWKVSQVIESLKQFEDSQPEVGQLLSAALYTRTNWSYFEGQGDLAEQFARQAIRHAKRVGFDRYTGGAIWTLGMTKIQRGSCGQSDIKFIDRLITLAEANLCQLTLPHTCFLRATRAALAEDAAMVEYHLAMSRDRLPSCRLESATDWWTEEEWHTAIDSYRLIFASYLNRPVLALKILEDSFNEEQPEHESSQYYWHLSRHFLKIGLVRLGSRERVDIDYDFIAPSVGRGIRDLATRVTGYRFRGLK